MVATSIDTAHWQTVDLPLYGARLRIPRDWETLPPVPANGHELVRATGGGGLQVIVFKLRAHSRSTAVIATKIQATLEPQGFTDFVVSEVGFAGPAGALLEFRYTGGDRPERTSWEYVAIRGSAVFVLGISSDEPDEHRPVVKAIAGTFALTRPAT